MGAGEPDCGAARDALGRTRLDVPHLPLPLAGHPAAALPAQHAAAVPPERQVWTRTLHSILRASTSEYTCVMRVLTACAWPALVSERGVAGRCAQQGQGSPRVLTQRQPHRKGCDWIRAGGVRADCARLGQPGFPGGEPTPPCMQHASVEARENPPHDCMQRSAICGACPLHLAGPVEREGGAVGAALLLRALRGGRP